MTPTKFFISAGCLALAATSWIALHASADNSQNADQAIAELQSTVATLQNRVQTLRDIGEIENLVSIYGYYLDKREWDPLAELFADDGIMEVSLRGVYIGKPSIRKALVLFGEPHLQANDLHNHMQLQPVIHVAPDGKTAKVRSRAFSQLGSYGRTGLWMGGMYENEYVKVNGVWKIKKDHVYTTYFAEYPQGWLNGTHHAAMPSDKIPPDGPASEMYEAFPGVYIPPFHYPHPVTGAAIEAKNAQGAAK